MMLNVTLFLIPLGIRAFHGQIMLTAFILEILIISIGLQGAGVGSANSHVPASRGCLWDLCRFASYRNRGERTSQC